MNKKIKELHERRAKAIADLRVLSDKLETEKRADFTAEEKVERDRLFDEQDSLRKKIDREVEIAKLEGELSEDRSGTKRIETAEGKAGSGDVRSSKEYSDIFRRYLVHGKEAVGSELRALSAGVLSEGGALIPPEQFVADLIKFIDDQVYIRQWATVYRVTEAKSLGAPSLDNDPADSDWTTELGTGSEDSTMSFGKRLLTPNPLAKRIKVSQSLMLMSSIPVERIVQERLGYKFAVTEEKAFLTGNGASRPLGVFTASSNGISTSRDVSTDNTTTAVTMDGLKNAKYAVKGAYYPACRWLFHRDAVKMISKLKDAENRYLWEPSNQAGQPDVLLGHPMFVSEYVPNTFTTGLYVGIFGDFSKYWIAESVAMTVQRLNELYAETNQVGFIGRMELDGMPVLEEAFARVKLA